MLHIKLIVVTSESYYSNHLLTKIVFTILIFNTYLDTVPTLIIYLIFIYQFHLGYILLTIVTLSNLTTKCFDSIIFEFYIV